MILASTSNGKYGVPPSTPLIYVALYGDAAIGRLIRFRLFSLTRQYFSLLHQILITPYSNP